MFGGTSTFGTTAPTFGTTSFTGPNTTNPFGATQQAGSPSLFGGTSGFNSPKPTGFGTTFGSPQLQQQSPSLFGQQNRLGGNATMFNSTAPVGSPFGAAVPQVQGTSVPFTAITGTDTMMKNGVASPINTRHQCITCMKEYEQKSLEELRFEDYQLGRKGSPQQSTVFGSTQAQPTGLFSSIAPASSTTNAFGQRGPTFGTVAPQPTTGLFTNLNQPKPNFFGTTPTSNAFGTPNTGFTFPSTQPQPTLFGQTNPATSTVGMGTTTGFSFSQPTQQPQQLGMNSFGQKPIMAPTPATSVPSFGFPAQTNQTLAKPNNTLFGTTSTFSNPTFGATTAPSNNIFNAPKPFSFGTTPASSSAFNFSNPITATPSFGFASSGFGAQTTTTQSTGFSSFGATPLTTNMGGFTGLGSTLGTQPSTGFSFTGSTFAQPNPMQQSQAPAAGPVPFPTSPYKDSPLFYNLVTNRNLEAMAKPTNPHAQRAMKEASRRRSSNALGSSVSQPMSLKQLTFPISKTPSFNNKTNTVFDGFDEDDHGPMVDILSPKTSVKKLSLKTVRNIHRLSLPLPATRSPAFNDTTHIGSISMTERSNTSMSSPNDTLELRNRTLDEESVTEGNEIQNGIMSPNQSTDFEIEGVRQLSPEPTETNRAQTTSTRQVKFYDHNSDTYVPMTREELDLATEGTEVNRCKVICTVPGYYVQPSVPELDLHTDNEGNCFIRGFCVGRHNYGQVRFLEVVNVAGLNIDEIVKFRHKEVVVYPDEMTPPMGEGLNVPSEVRLARVWPFNKKTREHIKDPEMIQALKYEELLRRSCERMDVDFGSYDAEEGEWVFKVKHFSKYTCVPEEEDEQELSPPPTKLPPRGLGGLTPAQIKLNCPQIPYCKEAYTPEDEPSLLILDQPTDYKKFQGMETQLTLQSMDESKLEVSIDTSRTILGNIFFPDEEVETDYLGKTVRGMVSMDIDNGDYTTGYQSMYEKNTSFGGKQDGFFEETSLLRGLPIESSTTVDTSKITEFTTTPRSNKKYPTVWNRRREEVNRKAMVYPFKLFANLLTDQSSVHLPPRSTRVCFGPGGQFLQILNNTRPSMLIHFNGQVSLNTMDTKVMQMEKTVVSNFKDIIGAQLDLYLEHSVLTNDTFSITSTEIVSAHVDKLTELINDSPRPTSAGTYLTDNLREEREVWKLLEILTENGNGFMASKNQKVEMIQRARLAKWLRSNASMLFSNLYKRNDTSVKGYLLKGLKQEASQQAIREKNYALALTLVQSNQQTQSRCRSQLEFWKQEGAISFVEPQLLELYGLCAGYPIWSDVDFNRMTTAQWLQHFAAFVWYLNPNHFSIDKIVSCFQATIRQTVTNAKISDNFSAPAVESADSTLSNLCIHLLKMYSTVGYPLNKVLSPKSHTADAFDYKVSWFLLTAFMTFGIRLSPGLVESVIVGFAQQLEMLSMWEWAVFILKFLPATEARQVLIKRLLERHVTLASRNLPEAEFRKKSLVLERIGINWEELGTISKLL